MKQAASKKYTLVFFVTVTLLLGGIAIFNVVVDPYGMYRLFEIKGLNVHKPTIYKRVKLLKAYDIRRLKPSAIVLGTSRSHIGIRVSHKGWDSAATPRYNSSFDGATTKEMYYYLKYANSIHPLKQVVLGLDTYHPTYAPSSARPDFDSRLVAEAGTIASRFLMRLNDLKLLVSGDTFLASITTLRSQNDDTPEFFAPDGQRLGEIYFRQVDEQFQTSPRVYFEKTDKLEIGYRLEDRNPIPEKIENQSPGFLSAQKINLETSLDYIRRIIEFCRANHVALLIFITPVHAHQLETSAVMGEWQSIEKAKLNLVDLLSKDAAMHPDEPEIPCFDFSGYNSITTEPLPETGSHNEMKYYWDSSHFKEVVGDFVLDRLFGITDPKHPIPADFGIRLTAGTIDSALARIRKDQIVYRKHHPREIEWIRLIVNSGSFPPKK